MSDVCKDLRDALVRCRAVLNTARRDTAADLKKPYRDSVLARRIDEATRAIEAYDERNGRAGA